MFIMGVDYHPSLQQIAFWDQQKVGAVKGCPTWRFSWLA